jgi:quinol monooxygenase YgiN
MSHLELHAHVKIRPGKLVGFKAQAAELIRIAREQDTKTIRYDWFINEDGTECEVHEVYVNEEGSSSTTCTSWRPVRSFSGTTHSITG